MVLGPLAGFIFAVFVYEVVVPGRSFRRVQDENKRLRELVETVIPLTAKMVEVCEQNAELLSRNTEVLSQMNQYLRDKS